MAQVYGAPSTAKAGAGRVDDLSTTCRRPVDDLSTTCRRPVDDLSTTCRRPVDDLSTTCRRPVDDLSTTCRRPADARLVRDLSGVVPGHREVAAGDRRRRRL